MITYDDVLLKRNPNCWSRVIRLLSGHAPKGGYMAHLPDWREYLPETLASKVTFRLQKWWNQRRSADLYPEYLDICNSGGKFGTPIPEHQLVLRKGFPKGSWEWQMHMYGAALYYHMASSRGESIVNLDENMLRNKQVLELECMRGGGARYLAQVCGPERYVATDESEENIKICKAVHEPFPPGLTFQQVKIAEISNAFEAESFDALLCVEAGAELDKKELVQSAKHVLNPGGLLLLCDAFMQEQVRDLLQELQHGFEVEVCTDIGKWIRATGLSPVNIAETHSVFGVAGCTYMRIVARRLWENGVFLWNYAVQRFYSIGVWLEVYSRRRFASHNSPQDWAGGSCCPGVVLR